jgi:hypothetical protein
VEGALEYLRPGGRMADSYEVAFKIEVIEKRGEE